MTRRTPPHADRGFSLPDGHDRLVELGRLAGGLVHELKNPLGVVLLNAELLAPQLAALPPEARAKAERRVQRIQDSARNLQAIVSSFLQFARPARPEPEAVDINRVLRDLLDEMSEPLAVSQVQVAFHPDAQLASVPGDSQHLRAIFRNIMVNARDALCERPADRRLLILSRAAPGSVRVVIANNGPPIPEAVAAHLFEPFASAKEGGTGLGLAIVRRLVELHRGTVEVSSDRDAGVSFTIELPTPLGAAAPPPALPAPAPVAAGGRWEVGSGGGKASKAGRSRRTARPPPDP